MSQRKRKTRKISPSDEELADEISTELESCEANSVASARGPYAIYNLLRQNKTDWMFSPMRISRIAEDMSAKGTITKISNDDPRYFKLPQKGKR
jgi:hypothetical protein